MMSQKDTIIVTGANGHLGSAIVRYIVSSLELQAYHSILIVRDKSVANTKLTSALKMAVSNVHRVATTTNGRVSAGAIPQIHGLVLNAAFIEFETQTWAEEGFDMAFVASYLGRWLLMVMLLRSVNLETGRITIDGSDAHNPDDWLIGIIGTYKHPNDKWRSFIAFGAWSTRADDPSTRNDLRRCGAAKFCLVTTISELQRRLNLDPLLHHISTVRDDPGTIASPEGYVMMWLCLESNGKMRTTTRSAGDIIRAVMDVSVAKAAYFDGPALAETTSEAKDAKKREMIWRDSVRYTQLKESETVLKDWK
ncbi:NAD(P)-binding protein [Annulohypoxylon maeteangense]|uniref:NAD(P)-binding protein n=1 Tax=Annulohypoxylon maeteangense TaxID=1927788 RepID=UPI0020076340|nr:NAD(P)-binding protein [Annulohypoxylon maeteangense]KAI0886435.1 NAD(P)-binding protein [Annulohypoxylon maeteangense]